MTGKNLVDEAHRRLNSACKPSRQDLPAVRWLMSDTRLLWHDCVATRFSRALRKASLSLGLQGQVLTADKVEKALRLLLYYRKSCLYESRIKAIHL